MKKIIIIIGIFIVTTLNANSKKNYDEYEKVAEEINTYLNGIELDDKITGNYSFEITLTITNENMINIVEVTTHSNAIKRNVKAALNDRNIKPGDLTIGKKYVFFIKVKEN